MTATEAAEKLTKAFNLDPPLPNKWNVIDTMAKKLGASAEAMVANKGALVQSERLGFSNGNFISGSEYADASVLDNWIKLVEGDYENMEGFKDLKDLPSTAYDGTNMVGSDAEEARDKYQAGYKNEIARQGLKKYGVRGKYGIDWVTLGNQGKIVSSGLLVGYNDPETGDFIPMDANAAQAARNAGVVDLEVATEEEETTEDTTEETTTPTDTTPATSVAIPDVTTPVTQPATVSVTPDPVELQQARKVFSPDNVVTLPTASFAMPPVQTPTVTAPEGVTMEQSPTFQANVDRQAQQFQDRANLQAQNLQPQTLAEKTAAGTTGMIEQRLYRNPQGMTLYITGTIDPNGVWNPTNPIPQGYAPVQNFSNGGLTGWDASTNTYRINGNAVGVIPPAQFNQFVKNVTGQEYTGGYRPGDSMSNPDVATGTIALTSGVDNIQPVTQTGGTGTTSVNLNTAANTNANTGTNTNTNTNTDTDTNTDTNTDTTGGTTGGQSPMFNVGG